MDGTGGIRIVESNEDILLYRHMDIFLRAVHIDRATATCRIRW
jgi:hypothetical protein